MRRIGSLVVVCLAVGGAAAWSVGDVPVRTDPSPVDALLASTAGEASAVAVAPETDGSATVGVELPLMPRAEWDLPKTRNQRVEYWIDFLAGRNRERTALWLEREGRYGGLIRQRLEARGMPQDLIYLGMIESGLSPKAYSHAHASGLWQFIAATGRRYGLEVSGYVDERRDPVKATDAALDYLSDLHDRFGAWYLAAAAYNSGEGRVERVLRQRAGGEKGREGLFWIIDEHLPRETRDYVPLMLAAAHIGKNPGKYGFHEVVLQTPLEYDEVRVPGGVSLTSVARAAGVDADEVRELNPHLLRGVTPPGREMEVRVPTGRAERVAASLKALERDTERMALVHRVRRGETLSHIARSYGIAVETLRAENGGLNPRRIQVGQRIRVPVHKEGSQRPEWTTYRVRTGDTLWGIARRHGVSVTELRSWNGIGSRIYPGQRIRIAA